MTEIKSFKEIFFDKNGFELFLISIIALFFELMLIRWIASEISIFGYFKNIILISSFLGLGIGCALANKVERNETLSFFVLLIITAFAGYFGLKYIMFVDPRDYYLLGSYYKLSINNILLAFVSVIGIYFLNVDVFYTIGLKLGKLLNTYKPIVAYSINILGSLTGILLFTLLSTLGTPPVLWLTVGAILLLYFYKKIAIQTFIIILLMLSNQALLKIDHQIIWSPYYKLDFYKGIDHDIIVINNDSFQNNIDFKNADSKFLDSLHYKYIYKVSNTKPNDVLIVGAGMGNDIAGALLNGAKHVDAVEIDPTIYNLGKKYNRLDVYNSPKVNIHLQDARKYFKETKKKYDYIIFGTLDSHVVLSSFSSIRVDNYVYTLESIKQAYKLLKQDGTIALTFYSTNNWLNERHYLTLKKASGQNPTVLKNTHDDKWLSFHTFIVGPLNKKNIDKMISKGILKDYTNNYQNTSIKVTTDNWPFLFLKKPMIPVYYILPLLILIVLSGIFIYYKLSKEETSLNLHMFFLGTAFMLLEVKAIAKLALLFGSTWLVNSIVISTIMILILFANYILYKKHNINYKFVYLMLIAAVLLDYFTPADFLLNINGILSIIANTFISCLPVFFAAMIFANSFTNTKHANIALGSNMFGAMLGGALEYISMLTGIKSLAFIVIFFYLMSYLTINKYLIWKKN